MSPSRLGKRQAGKLSAKRGSGRIIRIPQALATHKQILS